MQVPSSPTSSVPQRIADSRPQEASTPKDSNTPVPAKRSPRVSEQQLQKPETAVEVNGHNDKTVEIIGDNKIRVTLERGGRGRLKWRLFFGEWSYKYNTDVIP